MSSPADLRVLGRVAPSREQRADVLFGWPILEELARLGVGCALAVRERDVIAAQAGEPLEAVIERAGALCRRRGWSLLTAGGAAGAATIACLARARGRCLALRAAGADQPALVAAADAALVAAADAAKVAVVAVR